MSSKPRIGFCGLGAMGGGMAINLVKNGFPVTGYDVYTALVDKLVAAGGTAAGTPADAASKADYLILMVANQHQVSSLLFDGETAAAYELDEGRCIVLCSTTPPHFLHELRSRLDREGREDVKLLDCPVSGGTARAAEGTLSIFSSGADADLAAAAEVL
ncbi:hypothetical protein LTR66_008739, partial [Elasticomyces elasticus]